MSNTSNPTVDGIRSTGALFEGEKKMEKETGAQAPADTSTKKQPMSPMKKVIGVVVGIAAIIGGGYFLYDNYMFVSTDNAQIASRSTLLSSRVSGIIVKAEIEENQKVKAGQLLVEVKPDDYQNIVNQLEADTSALAATVKGAKSNYERTLELFKKGASTQERLDAAEAQYRSADQKEKASSAMVAQAKLNLDYTKITAPVDGKVGKKSFEVGMFTNAGQPLLGFVAGNDRWVVANIKETDMDGIVEGKQAYVTVDAIGGRTYQGVVESISPATGATFTLLPPDNATGNFTKVVQRVPVRIKLLNLDEHDIDRLQSGLSVVVKVKVH